MSNRVWVTRRNILQAQKGMLLWINYNYYAGVTSGSVPFCPAFFRNNWRSGLFHIAWSMQSPDKTKAIRGGYPLIRRCQTWCVVNYRFKWKAVPILPFCGLPFMIHPYIIGYSVKARPPVEPGCWSYVPAVLALARAIFYNSLHLNNKNSSKQCQRSEGAKNRLSKTRRGKRLGEQHVPPHWYNNLALVVATIYLLFSIIFTYALLGVEIFRQTWATVSNKITFRAITVMG